MLTQNDLTQIKTVVKDVVKDAVKDVVVQELKPINKEIKIINKRLDKLQNDLTTTINYFDHNFINHENRITIIEHQLNISQNI